MKTWMKFSLFLIFSMALAWFITKKSPEYFVKTDEHKDNTQNKIQTKQIPEAKRAPANKHQMASRPTLTQKQTSNKKSSKSEPFFPRRRGKEVFNGLKAINTPHPEWEKRFKTALFRFHLKAENFKLNHIESVARKEGENYRNLEWVKISYVSKGLPQSYDALVDSETGKVTKTWNHMKYEPMFNRHRKLSFSLKGILKSPEEN